MYDNMLWNCFERTGNISLYLNFKEGNNSHPNSITFNETVEKRD